MIPIQFVDLFVCLFEGKVYTIPQWPLEESQEYDHSLSPSQTLRAGHTDLTPMLLPLLRSQRMHIFFWIC